MRKMKQRAIKARIHACTAEWAGVYLGLIEKQLSIMVN
jgi:hypothetical protein